MWRQRHRPKGNVLTGTIKHVATDIVDFTASDIGLLANARIAEDTITATAGGNTYTLWVDFWLNWKNGVVERLVDGSMPAGLVTFSYNHEAV